MNILNGRNVYSVSRDELLAVVSHLEYNIKLIKDELKNRREDDSFGWGYVSNGTVVSWPTATEAIECSTAEFGEEGPYRVTIVYKIK